MHVCISNMTKQHSLFKPANARVKDEHIYSSGLETYSEDKE